MTKNAVAPLRLASLVASRVCHDLINPAGALQTGLEVLDEETDEAMKEEAMRLIRVSARKAVDQLSFARIAFGAGGAFGDEIDLAEAGRAAKGWFAHIRPELEWRVPGETAPKALCKAALCLAIVAADCIPRGGTVVVDGTSRSMRIVAEGPRARLVDLVAAALRCESEGLEPKTTPAFLAAAVLAEAGLRIVATVEDERVAFAMVDF